MAVSEKSNRYHELKSLRNAHNYINKEYTYVSIDDLDKEEIDGFGANERKEYTEAEFKAEFEDRIAEYEEILKMLPLEDDIDFDNASYQNMLLELEADSKMNEVDTSTAYGNKYAIRQDINHALYVCSSYDEFLEHMQNLGHTIEDTGSGLLIDGIYSSVFSYERSRYGDITDNYSKESLEKIFDNKEPSTAPNSHIYIPDRDKLIRSYLYKNYNNVDYRTEKVFLVSLYNKQGHKRPLIVRMFIKLFLRNRKAEREALEEAIKKEEKLQNIQDWQSKREEFAMQMSAKYDIYSVEQAKTAKIAISYKVKDIEIRESTLSKVLYIAKRNFANPSNYKRNGFTSAEEYKQDLEQTISVYEKSLSVLRTDKKDLLNDLKYIDNDLVPFIKEDMKRFMTHDMVAMRSLYKEEIDLDKIEQQQLRAEMKANFTKLKEKKHILETVAMDRHSLEEAIDTLKEERKKYIRLEKCVSEYNDSRNLEDRNNFVEEVAQNFVINGREVYEDKTVKVNGGERRIGQQIVLTTSPADKVTPSIQAEYTQYYLKEANDILSGKYQLETAIHADHFAGYDNGRLINEEMYKIKGECFGVHTHILASCLSCDGTNRMFHDKSDILRQLNKISYKADLEFGRTHTIQHNPIFIEKFDILASDKKFSNLSRKKQTELIFELQAAMGIKEVVKIDDTHFSFRGSTVEATSALDAVKAVYATKTLKEEAIPKLREEIIEKLTKRQTPSPAQRKKTKTPSLKQEKEAKITQNKEELLSFWIEHRNNPELLKDRIRADILHVINKKQPSNMVSLAKELRAMGYNVENKKGRNQLYFQPYNPYPVKERKDHTEVDFSGSRISTNELSFELNGELQNWSYTNINHMLSEKKVEAAISLGSSLETILRHGAEAMDLEHSCIINPVQEENRKAIEKLRAETREELQDKEKEQSEPAHKRMQSQLVKRDEPKLIIPDEKRNFVFLNSKKEWLTIIFSPEEIKQIVEELGGLIITSSENKTPEEEQLDDLKQRVKAYITSEGIDGYIKTEVACEHSPTMAKAVKEATTSEHKRVSIDIDRN